MKKDTIIQFVCFITELEIGPFINKWEQYARRLMTDQTKMALQQAQTKSRFRYVSSHECADRDFKFTFMNAKRSEDFPENNVKIVQAGGYTPIQLQRSSNKNNNDIKLMVFVSHDENDIDFYKELPSYHSLNIYQAYYENCAYGYILEYFIPKEDVSIALESLKERPGITIGQYKESMVPQL